MSEIITIKTAELAAAHNDTHIQTGSVGSCVVIALYDEIERVGGMAHAMLPIRNENKKDDENLDAPAKYTDEAVDKLIEEIEKIGGKRKNFVAKLVGGASMFKKLCSNEKRIGDRNIESARKCLEKHGIHIEKEDTGGNVGKSVELDLVTGLITVKSII